MNRLPNEILQSEILMHLPYPDIKNICLVDKRMQSICNSEAFWKRKAMNDFGISEKTFLGIDPDYSDEKKKSVAINKMRYDFLYSSPQSTINRQLYLAAKKGNEALVDFLVEKRDAKSYDAAMGTAADGGYQNIINKMIKLGAKDYGRAMVNAAAGGHEAIVKQMLDLIGKFGIKNTQSYQWAINAAIENGHQHIADLIKNRSS